MAETLRLFVSATKDLEAERAIIGRAVAELPVKIGIEIRRTPVDGGTYEAMYELIGNCDRVYFLMGRDITAPSGAEWLIAWKLERSVMPLRLAGLPTPAGQDFMRLLPSSGWQRFTNGAELTRLVTLDLVELLNHPKNRYGLSVTELELLNRHGRRIKQARIKTHGEPGGAEGGGILLDEGHREPIMGVALDER